MRRQTDTVFVPAEGGDKQVACLPPTDKNQDWSL